MRRVPPIFSPTAPLLPYPTLCRSLDIHLGQCRHQRLLRPLVALEQLGREAPGTVLRHPQLQLADPRHQRARVMPRTVAEPRIAALALSRATRLVHLGFPHRLPPAEPHHAKRIRLLRPPPFGSGNTNLIPSPGNVGSTRDNRQTTALQEP